MRYFNYSFYSFLLIIVTILMPENKTQAESFKDDDSSSVAVIDANYTLSESIEGIKIPTSVKDSLELITVQYYGFDGLLHQGQAKLHPWKWRMSRLPGPSWE